VKRVKNAALTTTTIEGEVTDTTVDGGSTESTTAPTDSVATTETPAASSQAVLTASTGADGDAFGGAVVVSADGSTLAVGSLHSNGDQGAVTVFARSGGKWVQQDILADENGAKKDWFGYSMAISKDGNTLAIGAVYADVSGNADQGNVHIYARSGGAWKLQKTLTGEGGAAGDVFGVSVAISNDGNTVAIGAAGDDVGSVSDKGSASVFVRKGAEWSAQQVLVDDNGAAKANFGSSVSLSSDGNTLAVGGPNAGKGSVVVFTRSNGAWS
jgi:WD40 repeat protein